MCLWQVIEHFSANAAEDESKIPWQLYAYATGVAIGSVLMVLCHHPQFFTLEHVGLKTRVATRSLVYSKVYSITLLYTFNYNHILNWVNGVKCLKLSAKALSQTTTGQVVNLIANDVGYYEICALFLHFLWVGPLLAVVSTVILYFILGPSGLIGAAIFALLVPFQSINHLKL